jgi:hypothetical protein
MNNFDLILRNIVRRASLPYKGARSPSANRSLISIMAGISAGLPLAAMVRKP